MYNKIYKQPIDMSAACSAISAIDKFSLLLKFRMCIFSFFFFFFFSILFLIFLFMCFTTK